MDFDRMSTKTQKSFPKFLFRIEKHRRNQILLAPKTRLYLKHISTNSQFKLTGHLSNLFRQKIIEFYCILLEKTREIAVDVTRPSQHRNSKYKQKEPTDFGGLFGQTNSSLKV